MCGRGETKDNKIELYLGWYGCYFKLNNEYFNPQRNEIRKSSIDKLVMIEKIKDNYNYDEFINAILECIENGDEG